ncbi:MAG: peptidyl-prolyl cis-trans isomerase [Desulfuromonadales bacterium]|nr:peptidyl-prolyl cis-trans isomerase [Desulfuromonadales bacterium]
MSTITKLTQSIFTLTIVAALVACSPETEKPKVKEPASDVNVVVVLVNEKPIYKSEVLRRTHAAYGSDVEKETTDPNRWQMLLDVATESEVMDELLLQTAVAEGMTVSDAKAQSLLDHTKEAAGNAAFSEMLKERGASEETFRTFLVEQSLINQYKEKLFDDLTVDDGTLQNYYKGHIETFAEPDQVRLEVFTFGVRETAEQIYARWTGGESFDAIAKAYQEEADSVGRKTRWMPVNAVPEELQSKITEAKAGTILKPAQVANTFYVVKIIEKREARVRDFEEVKVEISKEILRLRKDKALDEWYKSASREAKIEYVH